MSDPQVNFIENIAAAMDAYPPNAAPIAFVLGQMKWDSAGERDAFLQQTRWMVQ